MKALMLALTLVPFMPTLLLAHGVGYAIVGGAVAVKGEYLEGRPMAYAEAEVWEPDGTEAAQHGSADRHGIFAFVPDRDGVWRVTLDDGMGHRVEAVVEIGAGAPASGMTKGSTLAGGLSAAVVGVSLIFGFFGFWSLFLRRESAGPCT